MEIPDKNVIVKLYCCLIEWRCKNRCSTVEGYLLRIHRNFWKLHHALKYTMTGQHGSICLQNLGFWDIYGLEMSVLFDNYSLQLALLSGTKAWPHAVVILSNVLLLSPCLQILIVWNCRCINLLSHVHHFIFIFHYNTFISMYYIIFLVLILYLCNSDLCKFLVSSFHFCGTYVGPIPNVLSSH